jgi:hypothetical protein
MCSSKQKQYNKAKEWWSVAANSNFGFDRIILSATPHSVHRKNGPYLSSFLHKRTNASTFIFYHFIIVHLLSLKNIYVTNVFISFTKRHNSTLSSSCIVYDYEIIKLYVLVSWSNRGAICFILFRIRYETWYKLRCEKFN